MWELLLPVLTQLFGSSGPLADFFQSKTAQATALQQLQLAQTNAQIQALQANDELEESLEKAKLAATTQQFKQHTFYCLVLPIVFSIFFPNQAKTLWANLNLVPTWFSQLFVMIYLTIWGIPVALSNVSSMLTSMNSFLDNQSQRKVDKITALNKTKFYDELRTDLGGKLTTNTVTAIDKALNDAQ
jgi:hypothetical protein